MEPQNNQPQNSPAPGTDPNAGLSPTPLDPVSQPAVPPQPAPVPSDPNAAPSPAAAMPPANPQMPMATDAMASAQPAQQKKGLPMPILVIAAVVLIGVILALVLL